MGAHQDWGAQRAAYLDRKAVRSAGKRGAYVAELALDPVDEMGLITSVDQ